MSTPDTQRTPAPAPDKKRIEEEAQHFFEWPDPTRKDHVTLTSCVIFAATIAEMARAAERERWAKHLLDLAAGHQRAADMTDNSTVAQRHDAMAAALLAAIEGPNVADKRPVLRSA
jgi:hypothetical protein